MGTQDASTMVLSGVVVALLVDGLRQHQAWLWMRMVQGPAALKGVEGLRFVKVMGSGHGGGFTLRPSASHQGLIAIFDTAVHARAFLAGPVASAYRERAARWWSAIMAVVSSRGQWDGQSWAPATDTGLDAPADAPAPLAVLTRASIRPAKAMAFWRHAPATQASLEQAPGCLMAMALGEAPLLRQCTLSLWQDTAAMTAYSRTGAHQSAIAAAHRSGFFSESLFVRLRVIEQAGQWQVPHLSPPSDAAGGPNG